MSSQTPEFSIAVEAVKGSCPAGERYALEQIEQRRIPVLSCEGPCIRGEIARLAANLVAGEAPGLARACHAEAFFVPHSAMSRWVRDAERSVMIDGCFLQCHGRVLRNLTSPDKVIHFDAFRLHRKYADVFSMDDVPEAQRRDTARQVADAVLRELRPAPERGGTGATGSTLAGP